ncbi:hypothetical protein LTR99_010592 [Exophiala xenobiotica]|uniref:Pre-rRNA-processing protein RIX1 n=1 Tax=Vermiconidia calcicola TaxID=1690605 RepID=A0AAV9Q222_9PEZI|nr:hypothetical protein H2202_008727 [Exophiala xenobiotica]KAK5533802.1 hypothetical protein LTR25_006782 [Vermiconidia calcicola]KAK5546353.1 hypothetical protein LTR23_003458 [Chaetothyriales sp. CCFEE 6169]KAK5193040.1 hypothetical protein LTR92_007334 [Exophiala xenobiotica]KAK5212233.1 hypothetical protein LTR41_002475 [Exophiala xenobiotica]
MQHESALRAISNRLTVTPVDELPRIAGFLATQLANCPLNEHFANTKGSNSSVPVHKLKTRISSLVQERSAAGRFTAVVLIKAIIDNGGENALRASDSWARGLLNCLNKPDPIEVKKLYLITLTRIFILTQNDQTLSREITTPLLPSFIKASLGLVRPINVQKGAGSKAVSSPLLTPVLECWTRLLPRHASVFRPFLNQLRPICLSLVADVESSSLDRDLAIQLLCLLLWSAPRNTVAQEWNQMAANLIKAVHETASKLFRAVIEEHESNDSSLQITTGKHNFSKETKQVEVDLAGLHPWAGIYEGSDRLAALLSWLTCLVSTSTPESMLLPIGVALDLTSRVMSVTVPASKAGAADDLRYHKDASREEKEELWTHLPQIHMACLDLLHSLFSSYGQVLSPVQRTNVNQLLDLFENMSWHQDIRSGVYKIFSHQLERIDVSNLDINREALAKVLEHCCIDLKSGFAERVDSTPSALKTGAIQITSGSISGGTQETVASFSSRRPNVFEAAWVLLSQALRYCPGTLMSRRIRSDMDRIAVLLDHRDAMLSSILNPILSKEGKAANASLLPFVVRSAADEIAVEALLRPRMPFIAVGSSEIEHPSSQDGANGEHEGEDESDARMDTDILSQLEDSVEQQQNGTLETKDARPEGSSGSRDIPLNESQSSGAQKRLIDAVDSSVLEGNAIPSGEPDSRDSKRPRSGAVLEDTMLPEIQENSNEAAAGEYPMAQSLGFTAVSSQGQQFQVERQDMSMVSNASVPGGPPVDDGDSDDSEIPAIDPELDTDEEEDLE